MQTQNTKIELNPTCGYCGHNNQFGTHCGMCRRGLKPLFNQNIRNTSTQVRLPRKSGFPRATLASPLVPNVAKPTKGWFYRRKMNKTLAIDQLLAE